MKECIVIHANRGDQDSLTVNKLKKALKKFYGEDSRIITLYTGEKEERIQVTKL
jgi:hypothetical protein